MNVITDGPSHPETGHRDDSSRTATRMARFLMVVASVLGASVLSPATAYATPVAPARALLSQAEFPEGSTGYTREDRADLTTSERPTGDPARYTPCERSFATMFGVLDDASAAEATARRGTTRLGVTVIDAEVLRHARELFRTCNAEYPPDQRTRELATPADLAGVRPYLVANGRHELIAWVQLRGITIHVDAWVIGGQALDTAAFWQALRAQVAKVERQP